MNSNRCPALLSLSGEHHRCDEQAGHGPAHVNSTAHAVWSSDPHLVTETVLEPDRSSSVLQQPDPA